MSSFSAQPIVIDGKGHLLGRLASVIAKQVSVLVLDLLAMRCCGRREWEWLWGVEWRNSGESVEMMEMKRLSFTGKNMDFVVVTWRSKRIGGRMRGLSLKDTQYRTFADSISLVTPFIPTLRPSSLSLAHYHLTDPFRPKGHRRPKRGDQRLGFVLQEQAQVPQLLAQ